MPHDIRDLVAPDPNNGIRGDKLKASTMNEVRAALRNTYTIPEVDALAGGYEFDLRIYGATGNGTTNDTAAFAAAIAAMSDGDVLYVPTGTYRVNSAGTYAGAINVTKSITILGERGSVIKAATGANTGVRMLSVNADDVVIEGLTFEGLTIADLTQVYIAGGDRITIRNNHFLDPQSGGVHIAGACPDLSVTGNQFSGWGYGILTADFAGAGGWLIANNVFRGTGADDGDAIELNFPTNGVDDVAITGNVIADYWNEPQQNAGFGIGVARGRNITITGNQVSACSRNGIHIEASSLDVAISGNTVHSCGNAGIEAQYFNTGTPAQVESISITGNTVYNCCLLPDIPTENLGYAGIEIASASTAARGVTVIGNTSRGNAAAGIRLYDSPDSIVSGNICKNNTGYGLDLHNIARSVITGNRCYDDQGVKTQTHGIYCGGTAVGSIISNNILYDNATDPFYFTGFGATQPTAMVNNLAEPAFYLPITTSGYGTPEGVVTAPTGSQFNRIDGSTSTSLYMKTSGNSNTGWTAK